MRLLIFLCVSIVSAQDLRFIRGEYENRKFDEIYGSGNSLWLGIGVIGGTDL